VQEAALEVTLEKGMSEEILTAGCVDAAPSIVEI
jgi:hypothetical protein